jgi:hypothetical protein
MSTLQYLVRSQRDVIGWALGNACADPDVAEKITGSMRLDEMVEILGHIQNLTILIHGNTSQRVH